MEFPTQHIFQIMNTLKIKKMAPLWNR